MIHNVLKEIDKLNSVYVDVWEDVCNLGKPLQG